MRGWGNVLSKRHNPERVYSVLDTGGGGEGSSRSWPVSLQVCKESFDPFHLGTLVEVSL